MESTPSAPCPQISGVQEPAVVDIDPDGDLLLKVGCMSCVFPGDPGAGQMEEGSVEDHDHAPPVTFRVCSRTLGRSSPVWEKMLFGVFAESKPKHDDWIVRLPDDDIAAVEFFLNTIHARFDDIPSFLDELDPHRLYEITVVADKYDMVRLVRPWADGWVSQIYQDVRAGDEDISTLAQYLWILWVLGAKSEYVKVVRYTVMAWGEDDLVHDVLELPGIAKIIHETRRALLTDALFPFQDAFDKLSMGGRNHRYNCKAGISDCEDKMLGGLVRSLRNHQLWPIPNASDVRISVNRLVEILNEVDRETVRSRHGANAASKPVNLCSKVLDRPICRSSLRGKIRVLLTNHHKTHFEEHGSATGLATTSKEPPQKRMKLS